MDVIPIMDVSLMSSNDMELTTKTAITKIDEYRNRASFAIGAEFGSLTSNNITTALGVTKSAQNIVKLHRIVELGQIIAGKMNLQGQYVDALKMLENMRKVDDDEYFLLAKQQLDDFSKSPKTLAEVQAEADKYAKKGEQLILEFGTFIRNFRHKAVANHRHHMRLRGANSNHVEEPRSNTPCPFFARNCCRFGDNCRNSHAPITIAAAPAAAPPPQRTIPAAPLRTLTAGAKPFAPANGLPPQ